VRNAAVTSGTVTANVYLAGRDPSGMTAYATAVSTPDSALYGHYLSAQQVYKEHVVPESLATSLPTARRAAF
jgi:subtilase family serine protease